MYVDRSCYKGNFKRTVFASPAGEPLLYCELSLEKEDKNSQMIFLPDISPQNVLRCMGIPPW